MKKYIVCIVLLLAYGLIATIAAIFYKFKVNTEDTTQEKQKPTINKPEIVSLDDNIKMENVIRIEKEDDVVEIDDIAEENSNGKEKKYNVRQRFDEMFKKANEYANLMRSYTELAKVWENYITKDTDKKINLFITLLRTQLY